MADFYQSKEWKVLRARHLKANPYCRVCMMIGQLVKGRQVDHIIEINSGGPKLDPRNLQTLCDEHHNQKTNGRTFTVCGPDGYDREEVVRVGSSFERGKRGDQQRKDKP